MSWPRIAVSGATTVVAFALGYFIGDRDHPGVLPAPVELSGIAGVRPGMSAEALRERWDMALPEVVTQEGSTELSRALICADEMRGEARFFSDQLMFIEFVGSARTSENVGIGSSRAELIDTYGDRLTPVGENRLILVAETAPPRTAISFEMEEGRVVRLRWGRLAEISGLEPATLEVYC